MRNMASLQTPYVCVAWAFIASNSWLHTLYDYIVIVRHFGANLFHVVFTRHYLTVANSFDLWFHRIRSRARETEEKCPKSRVISTSVTYTGISSVLCARCSIPASLFKLLIILHFVPLTRRLFCLRFEPIVYAYHIKVIFECTNAPITCKVFLHTFYCNFYMIFGLKTCIKVGKGEKIVSANSVAFGHHDAVSFKRRKVTSDHIFLISAFYAFVFIWLSLGSFKSTKFCV